MDIQNLVDAIGKISENDRSKYHVTLGALIEKLSVCDPALPVVTDQGDCIGNPHSYRGYYSDLSFERVRASTVADVLSDARDSLGHTFTGWKGGDFRMHDKTPLWIAAEGCCGLAVVGTHIEPDKFVLTTKNVDE